MWGANNVDNWVSIDSRTELVFGEGYYQPAYSPGPSACEHYTMASKQKE
jgi:hypothetical protein